MGEFNEIVKSGAGEKAADLVNKLTGPMFEQIGEMLGDFIKPYRVKNLIRIVQKTEKILKDAGLPANAVPTRLLFPIMEASSLEDNETLQEMWAGLLATASQQTESVSPSFIETLKQLTPDDARHLEAICKASVKYFNKRNRLDKERHKIFDSLALVPWAFGPGRLPSSLPERFDVPPNVYPDLYVRLGLIRTTFEIASSFDRRDLDAYGDAEIHQKVNSEVDGWYEFTEYAVRFLDACHGPCRAKD